MEPLMHTLGRVDSVADICIRAIEGQHYNFIIYHHYHHHSFKNALIGTIRKC